jgi:nucleotide-binding universal stress UspA family protein
MFKKILVPTDGSDIALSAIDLAADLAKSQGASVLGLYVIDPYPYSAMGEAASVGFETYFAHAKEAAIKALNAVDERCKAAGVPCTTDVVERSVVYEAIIESATSEQCDLIVMSSHGRRGVKAVLLGSVAQQVLTHSDIPVLVVKAKAKAKTKA